MGDGEIGDVFLLEEDVVRHLFCIRFLDSTDMDTVVVWGGVEVPSVYGMVILRCTYPGFFVNDDCASHWSEWYFIVI